MTLYQKILTIYPKMTDIDFIATVSLQNDSDKDYIARWQHPLYKMPTIEQLEGLN